MLTQEQVNFYHEHGYVRIPEVFSPQHIQAMRDDLDWMIRVWANVGVGWTGPWRKQLMDIETEAKSKLIAMHDLHFYARSWMKAVTDDGLTEAMADLMAGHDPGSDPADTPVELHHSTMHVKPSETGHPFPMHQDLAFYPHEDNRYCDVLVHLDDTSDENGEIRFLDASHKLGPLEHICKFVNDDGETESCTPHLDPSQYRLEDTVAVPAKAGDVVVFNIRTIHGSYINKTNDLRRMVRVGYKHPENVQTGGQSHLRPGLMVRGRRPRGEGQILFGTGGPTDTVMSEDAEQFAVKLG
ncbi:MAG: phytanoyl-CoA dioxygenase family protein [Phycisphaeraceae bacterium]